MQHDPSTSQPSFIDVELRLEVREMRLNATKNFCQPATLAEIVSTIGKVVREHYKVTGRPDASITLRHPAVNQAVADSAHCRQRLLEQLQLADATVTGVDLTFEWGYDDQSLVDGPPRRGFITVHFGQGFSLRPRPSFGPSTD